MPQGQLTGQFLKKPTFRVWCLYSSFVHGYQYLRDEIPRRGGIDEGENDLPGGEEGGGGVTVQHLHREQLRLRPARHTQPLLYLCNT